MDGPKLLARNHQVNAIMTESVFMAISSLSPLVLHWLRAPPIAPSALIDISVAPNGGTCSVPVSARAVSLLYLAILPNLT